LEIAVVVLPARC